MGSVSVRWMKATNRAWLNAHHHEQLFGAGATATAVWPGVAAEPLALERVVASGSGNRKVSVRLVAQEPPGITRVALTAHALATLDIHNVPAFGAANGPGVALTGPKGALVLAAGVCRAGTRLVLPEGVARKLGVEGGQSVGVSVQGTPDAPEERAELEVRPGVREGLLVVDAPLAERLGEPGGMLTLKLSRG